MSARPILFATLSYFCLAVARPAIATEAPDLSWLAGHWCSPGQDSFVEELWLPERGGLMLGMNRSVSGPEVSFEFLRIEIAPGATRFVGQPGGAPPTPFELMEHRPDFASFENPAHDYPKRIRYRRDGEVLTAVTDAGADDPKPIEFRWKLCGSTQARGISN